MEGRQDVGNLRVLDRASSADELSAELVDHARSLSAFLPSATVTFLLTDVVDSTRLWDSYPDAMRVALKRHDAIIDEIVVGHAGRLVRPRGEGDSRFAVFERATNAVAAAAALQQALSAEAWPTPAPLRVRLALHTGEADLRDGD